MVEVNESYFLVKMKNFRCHLDLEVEVLNGLSHLRGMNGRGKSTFFDAVKWCLYGGRGGIAPWPSLLNGRKSRPTTSVEISTESYRIYRRNSPCQLIYEDDSGRYTDADAQYQVGLLFGTHPLWYVSQRCDSLLMTAADSVRHEAIMNLIFPGNNVKELIDTAKNHHKLLQSELVEVTEEMERLKYEVDSTKEKYKLSRKHFERVTELNSMENKLASMREELDTILEMNGKISQYQDHKRSVSNRLAAMNKIDIQDIKRLEAEVDTSPAIQLELDENENIIHNLKLEYLNKTNQLMADRMEYSKSNQLQVDQWKSRLDKCKDYNRVKSEIYSVLENKCKNEEQITTLTTKLHSIENKLKELSPQYSHLTDREFDDLYSRNIADERSRSSHYSKAKKLRIPYTVEAIEAEKNKLRGMVIRDIDAVRQEHAQLSNSMVTKIRVARELPRVRDERENLVQELDKATSQVEQVEKLIADIDIDELHKSKEDLMARLQHSTLAESYKRLKCPHCEKDCGLHNGELVSEVPESNDDSTELTHLINSVNSHIRKRQSDLTKFNRRMNSLSANQARLQAEIRSIDMKIKELENESNLEIDADLVTSLSRKIKDHDHATDRYRDVKRLEVIELINLTDDKEERRLKNECNSINDHIQRLNVDKFTSQIDQLEGKLDSLASEYTIESINKKVAIINRDLSNYEAKYSKKVDDIKSEHQRRVKRIENMISKLKLSLREEVDKNRSRANIIKEMKDQIATYNMLVKQLDDLDSSPLHDKRITDTSQFKKDLNALKIDIDKVERASELTSKIELISTLEEKIEDMTKMILNGSEMLTHLQKFKYVRIESYFQQLSQYCNRFLEVILKNENIIMTVAIDKKLKSGKTKNVVHINVIKNNHEIDYATMNVGHKQILSLVLTLSIALTRINSVQVIFLDEILNSLSVNLKDACLNLFNDANLNPLYKMMEPIIKSKKVILIDHGLKHHAQCIKL